MRAGISSSSIASAADSWSAVGITSFEDWQRLTSSLGWTSRPEAGLDARCAMTSFMFVLVEVPEPGLVDVDRELVVVAAVGDLAGGGGDRLRLRGVEQPEALVGLGGGELDQRQRPQEAARHALARDREVEDRPLGRGAVEGVRRDLHLAHRVAFHAGRRGCGRGRVVLMLLMVGDPVRGRAGRAYGSAAPGTPRSAGQRLAVHRPGRVLDEHDQLAVRPDRGVGDVAGLGRAGERLGVTGRAAFEARGHVLPAPRELVAHRQQPHLGLLRRQAGGCPSSTARRPGGPGCPRRWAAPGA